MSYVRSRSHLFSFPKDFYRHIDIHIHVPEGAIPKDGPSAGITLCTSIVSALTRIPVRCDVAMTGEITLRGKVLPIGGVKEKLMAAHRLGLKTVILPKDNEKDLAEIPPEIQAQMSIHFVESMDEVAARARASPSHPGSSTGCRSGTEVRLGCRTGQRINQLNLRSLSISCSAGPAATECKDFLYASPFQLAATSRRKWFVRTLAFWPAFERAPVEKWVAHRTPGTAAVRSVALPVFIHTTQIRAWEPGLIRKELDEH